MQLLKEIKDSLLHLAFPHVCEGCGTELFGHGQFLCVRCLSSLPKTNFHFHPNNPIEKLFWGRLPVTHASALYYFTKESLIQRLMHQFKYKGNKELGLFLGKLMGSALLEANRFAFTDLLVPLPLFRSREHKRGYNQAAVLCEGIASVMNKPVLKDVLIRRSHTDTQTAKGRVDRWLNMEGRFELINEKAIAGKHVLLVDDVVTTGATLEACGRALLKADNIQLSVATLCYSAH
jgi:ComF family protein